MIRLHLIAYVVFLCSFLLYLVAFIVNNQVILSVFTTLVGITNLISELILVFIFNSILNAEVSRTKNDTPAQMPQYEQKLIEDPESSSEDENQNLAFYGSAKVFKQVRIDSVNSSDAMII